MAQENDFALAKGEIHLWQAEISKVLPWADRSQLNVQEQTSFDDVKSAKVRDQFLISHWSTRQILSRYLEIPPSQVAFQLSPEGKPSLISKSRISFNRSHSGGFWVLALARDLEIGVDIEETNKHRQLEGIVDRWFTVSEKEHFQGLPELDRASYFHTCWTQKEAVLKAAGVGLSHLGDYPSLARHYGITMFSPSPTITGCIAYKLSGDLPPPRIKYLTLERLLLHGHAGSATAAGG